MDPLTISLIAAAVSAGAGAIGSGIANSKQAKANKKAEKNAKETERLRARETKRETREGLLEDALNRGVESQARRAAGAQKLSKSKAQSMQNTSDLVREAFNI